MSTKSRYAGILKRFVAILIDAIILQIVFFIAFGQQPTTWNNPRDILYYLFTTLIGWIYFAVMESSLLQATFGKRLLGIIVTDTNGNQISFGKATTRYFGKSLFLLIVIIALLIAFMAQSIGGEKSPYWALAGLLFIIAILVFFIGYLMAAFTPEKQALHDIIARCLVVNGSGQSGKIPWKTLIGLAVAAIVAGRVLSQVPRDRPVDTTPSPSLSVTTELPSTSPQETPTDTPSPPTSGRFNFCGSNMLLIDPGNANIDGDWRLEWTAAGDVYVARLQMQGSSGKATVLFPDGKGGQIAVNQRMQLYTSSYGLVLLGSNPVYANTGSSTTSYPNYSPDNFLFRTELNGLRTVITCDNNGNRSPVSVKPFSNDQ